MKESGTLAQEEEIPVSKMFLRHVQILIFRVLLLAAALCLYIADRKKLDFAAMPRLDPGGVFLMAVWLVLAVGMLCRLIPNKRVALGARKHFACSFSAASLTESDPGITPETRRRLHKGALSSALAWIAFNAAAFFALFPNGSPAAAPVVILMLFYAICDTVCIIFFCPFQVFFMRNRCCTVCRIYNWDYIMICTPLILIPCAYSISLLLLSVSVLICWEAALRKTPSFFIEETNENLRCERCEDKLCRLRKALER